MASDAAVVSYEDQFLTFLAVWLVPRHRTRPDARPRAGSTPAGQCFPVLEYLSAGRAPVRPSAASVPLQQPRGAPETQLIELLPVW